MKIKKTFQGSLPENRILNTHSSSQTDTYSCDYINDSSVIVSATEPVTNRKRVWMQKGKNLFDKNQVEKNCYIDLSGLKIVNSGWCITNFIKVIPKKEYSYQGLTISGTAPYSAYYDENKNYISSFKQATGNNNITIPENAYYIRFSICLKDISTGIDFNDLNTFQIEQGSTATSYEEYVENKIYIKNDNDVYEEFIKREEEIYSTAERSIGKWIDGKTLYKKTVIYIPDKIIGEKGKTIDISIPHKVTNFNQLCDISVITSTGHILPSLGSENGTDVDYGTRIFQVDKINIYLKIINDTWGIRTWFLTLKYTKTID